MTSAERQSSSASRLVLEEFLPYRLSVLSNRVSRAIAERYAKAFDLTIPEWRVIAVLGEQAGLSAKQIAEATEMDKVAVSRAVSRLVRAGRVAAQADGADARRQLLTLTPHGADLHRRIAPMALEAERALVNELSLEERARLMSMLDRLHAAAENI